MFSKQSYIKRLPDGKYRVLSKKNKNLGTYDKKSDAEKRLAQVEMFKHMYKYKNKKSWRKKKRKKAINNIYSFIKGADDTKVSKFNYSQIMRDLNKNNPDKIEPFMKSFKKAFDEAQEKELESPEGTALISAMYTINYSADKESSLLPNRFIKLAAAVVEMGEPGAAGKALADIVKFLVSRISIESRANSLLGLKNKIFNLNEFEIAQKKTPASASLGQSLTFIKTILNGHSPSYIRAVLDSVAENL